MRVKELNNVGTRQRWARREEVIVNSDRPEEVLDIYKRNEEEGAKLVAWKHKGRSNQLWTFEPCEVEE